MPYSHKFAEALAYAATLHQMQLRKGTSNPYVGHLLGVASIVIDAGGTEEEAIAALLHDAAEDQGGHARLEDISERFGPGVAAIVEGCSDAFAEPGAEKGPYDERKRRYIEHLTACDDERVYLVSAADKLHNAGATLADITAHGQSVWSRFNAPREKILKNYEALVDVYTAGPIDERRGRIVEQLGATIAALRSKL